MDKTSKKNTHLVVTYWEKIHLKRRNTRSYYYWTQQTLKINNWERKTASPTIKNFREKKLIAKLTAKIYREKMTPSKI
jgi:hypothetical protein